MKNKIIIGIVAVLVFLALIGQCSNDKPEPKLEYKTPEQVKQEQQQAKIEAEKQKAQEIQRKNEEIIKKANIELGYEPPPITADKIKMLTACQMQVQQGLKSPNSFKMYGDYRYVVADEDLRINFQYLAKNSFNAEIKGRAICVFTRDGKMIKTDIK